MAVDKDNVFARAEVWQLASTLVEKIVDKHGLEKYSNGTFVNQVVTYTKTEQHLTHITTLADWLLDA